MIKKRKLKKQNNVKLLLVFLWSPFCLHYTEHRVETVEKGLVCDSGVNKLHRCESDITVWQRAVRKKKQHMTALEKGANRLGGILTYTTIWKLFLTPVLSQDVCCCVAMKQYDSSVCFTFKFK